LKDPKKEEKKPDPKEMTYEERFNQLNQEFHEYKSKQEQEATNNRIQRDLNDAINSFDLFKNTEYAALIPGAKAEALARQSLNPRMSLKDAVAAVVEDRMKLIKAVETNSEAKYKNGRLLENSTKGIVRGPSGIPQIDSEKKFTPEDVVKGESLKALQALLNRGE